MNIKIGNSLECFNEIYEHNILMRRVGPSSVRKPNASYIHSTVCVYVKIRVCVSVYFQCRMALKLRLFAVHLNRIRRCLHNILRL